MQKKDIYENFIREMSEVALAARKKYCKKEEYQLYKEVEGLSQQVRNILNKLIPDDYQVLNDYLVKTSLIADHECEYLYVQGAKDCIELLKKLGVL